MRVPSATNFETVVPKGAAWVLGVAYFTAILFPAGIGAAGRGLLFTLVAVGLVSVFMRLRASVPSPPIRALISLSLAGAFAFLTLVVDSVYQLVGVGLGMALAWLGVDQLFRWAIRADLGRRTPLVAFGVSPRRDAGDHKSKRHGATESDLTRYLRADAEAEAQSTSRAGRPLNGRDSEGGATPDPSTHDSDELASYLREDAKGDPEAAFRAGLLLEQAGDVERAEAAFRRADDRGHACGATEVGRLLHNRGDWEGAQAAYRRGAEGGDAAAAAALGESRKRPRIVRDVGRSAGPTRRRRLLDVGNAEEAHAENPNGRLTDTGINAAHSELETARRRLRDSLDDAAATLGPPVEHHLVAVYGPDWLTQVNARRAEDSEARIANGMGALRPFQPNGVRCDPRDSISVIAYDPALKDHFGPRARADARRLAGIANALHHPSDYVDLATIHDATRILRELCQIAERMTSQS